VAVRTANLALGNFGVDRRDAAAVPGQGRDLGSLGPDVIEVEHDRIALPAVDAPALPEESVEVSEVAGYRRVRVGAPRSFGRIGAAPARALCGPSSMAVDADDFALLDLAIKDIDCDAGCDESRDPGRLLAYVVELEHDWIVLAAVDARMFEKVRDNVGMEDACSRLLRRIRLAAVEIPTRPEVRAEA
jgi:hypothetical protein